MDNDTCLNKKCVNKFKELKLKKRDVLILSHSIHTSIKCTFSQPYSLREEEGIRRTHVT